MTEDIHYLRHHHHHHRHNHDRGMGHEYQGPSTRSQYEAFPQGISSLNCRIVAESHYQDQQQQEVNQPAVVVSTDVSSVSKDQVLKTIRAADSSHSVSSFNSAAEISTHLPNGQKAGLSLLRHPREVQGQTQATATSTQVLIETISAVPSAPYVSIVSRPLGPFLMAQQPPVRPPGPRQPAPGIPSYPSQIEGLSISQDVVNDVLLDLQTKVLNETLQQYHDEGSSDIHLNPLPPIYIRAPQPTLVLQSDLNRLRAELNQRVRPPVIYRYPANENRFQQPRFQHNTFQAPRFPAPQPRHVRPEHYDQHRNAAFTNSAEYRTTSTRDEQKGEGDERLHNQAESAALNDDNVNAHVHSAVDFQGPSTASFDRHALSSTSSSFLPPLEHEQQYQRGYQENQVASSHTTDEEDTENMYPNPARPRQDLTFDINNCIQRCFDAHQQTVARRRAAKQERKARRHQQRQQQQPTPQQQQHQYQNLYQTGPYPNVPSSQPYSTFGSIEQGQWQQQPPSSTQYADITRGYGSASAATYLPPGATLLHDSYDYAGLGQSTSLPDTVQQLQFSQFSGTQTGHIPFSSVAPSNFATTTAASYRQVPTDDYYQYKTTDIPAPSIDSTAYGYSSQQTVSNAASLAQQIPYESSQQQTAYGYSGQTTYPSSYETIDRTVPTEIQHLKSEYYQQQQQVPTQFLDNQVSYNQPSESYAYAQEGTQNQGTVYTYPQATFNLAGASASAYAPSQIDTRITGQSQATATLTHAEQRIPSQPTGTVEYTRESYQTQEPIFAHQDIQQTVSFESETADASSFAEPDVTGQQQRLDVSSQRRGASEYHQEQPASATTSQLRGPYSQPSGTVEYTRESYQSQQPIYNYQDVNQQAAQYTYSADEVQQQAPVDSYSYDTGVSSGSYAQTETLSSVLPQERIADYSNQVHQTADYYAEQQIPASTTYTQGSYSQPTGTYEYNQESYQSQQPIYDYQGVIQQAAQYTYSADEVQQQAPTDSYNYDTLATSATYSGVETSADLASSKQRVDIIAQAVNASKQFQGTSTVVPISQTQGSYSQPTGTYEYTRESHQSQQPIYGYQDVNQQASQYTYKAKEVQQQAPADSYRYDAGISSETYAQVETVGSALQQEQVADYYTEQQIPASTIYAQGAYGQPTGTYEYTRESHQSQQPIYGYQDVNQQASQYTYNAEEVQQQAPADSYRYEAGISSETYVPTETLGSVLQQERVADYYTEQQIPTSTIYSQGAYGQPTGTYEYTRESHQSQQPIYSYQDVNQQAAQYTYSADEVQQQVPADSYSYDTSISSVTHTQPEVVRTIIPQDQVVDYSNQAYSSTGFYPELQVPAPTTYTHGPYGQPTGTVEYTRETHQSQRPIYESQAVTLETSQYSELLEQEEGQPKHLRVPDKKPEETVEQVEFKETRQTVESSEQRLQQPVSIPVARIYDTHTSSQRSTGASVPTGIVEYTRQAYYTQEPLADNITTEAFIEQHQELEKPSPSFHDRVNYFESQSYPEQTRGPQESSYYEQFTSVETAPSYATLRDSDTQLPYETRQTYDLQNYTNQPLEPTRPQIPQPSSYEEGQQHLLRQTVVSEQTRPPYQQADQRSDIDTSSYNTFSSLPPPPFSEYIEQQQSSITTNVTDFPAPPTPDRHTYQLRQQRPGRVITSIIPSHEQTNLYIPPQAPPPITTPFSDRNTEADISEIENVELRGYRALPYTNYGDLQPRGHTYREFHQQIETVPPYVPAQYVPSEQRSQQYQQVIEQSTIPPIYPEHRQSTAQSTTRSDYQERPRPNLGTNEMYFNDTWTQTPPGQGTSTFNTVQQRQEQTPSYFHVPQFGIGDRSIDARAQPTIEYSPPLLTHSHQFYHTSPTIAPTLPRAVDRYEQQQASEQIQQIQTQPIYDHASPVPPHLSFNDNDYQLHLYPRSRETTQPRQPVNIPLHDDEKQTLHQQRYRAHSEPPSTQQDITASIPPLEPFSSPVFERKPRRSVSIPAIHRERHEQQTMSAQAPPVHMLDDGRAYEMDASYMHYKPRIDPKTGLCLVPCPNAKKYAHLPPHLRPELFCIELPPPGSLPPVPPPPPPQARRQRQQQQQHGRFCVKCCCKPGRTMIKKIVYRQVGADQQYQQGAHLDYSSVIDQMATRVNVRYGNDIMEDGGTFVSGNYNEQLRVMDFPVYVSGENDPTLTPLVPAN